MASVSVMMSTKDYLTYKIIYNKCSGLSLSQTTLSWTSTVFEIKRVLYMINIWNIDIFERTQHPLFKQILCQWDYSDGF